MNNINLLFDHSRKLVETSITEACERTLYLAKQYPSISEILKETLWANSNILAKVFGWLNEDESGWKGSWGTEYDAVLSRICFANQFAGYEILDDGDPGIAYRRYYGVMTNDEPGIYGYNVCEKGHENAELFITSFREKFCKKNDWLPSICTEESVLAVFRWCEEDEAKRLAWCLEDAKENGEDTNKIEYLKTKVDPATTVIRQWMRDNDIVPKSK